MFLLLGTSICDQQLSTVQYTWAKDGEGINITNLVTSNLKKAEKQN